MKVKELIKHLLDNYDVNETIAYSLWSKDDILSRAEERGITLNNSGVILVLDFIDRHKSAVEGINWDVIDSALDYIAK